MQYMCAGESRIADSPASYNLRSKRFRAVQEQRTGSESQRPSEKLLK